MSTCEAGTARPAVVRAVADYVTAMLTRPEALRGQQLRGGGPVAEFEMVLAETCGFPYCLATSNATTALLVVALAADLRDVEIIGPPNCWPGTVGPFELAGCRVVRTKAAADGTLCPRSVRNLLSGRTSAVLAVDWQGKRHKATQIRQICDKHHLLYIEDTAVIPGITVPSDIPSLADVQVLSFGPGKPLPLGEGGAVLTRSRRVYENAILLSQHPERWASEDFPSESSLMPLNARMHPVAALLGVHLLRSAHAPVHSIRLDIPRPLRYPPSMVRKGSGAMNGRGTPSRLRNHCRIVDTAAQPQD